jgi:hypothetical protein
MIKKLFFDSLPIGVVISMSEAFVFIFLILVAVDCLNLLFHAVKLMFKVITRHARVVEALSAWNRGLSADCDVDTIRLSHGGLALR